MRYRDWVVWIAGFGAAAAAQACSGEIAVTKTATDAGVDAVDASAGAPPPPPTTIDAGAPPAIDSGDAVDCAAENATGGPPQHLVCTGLYSDFASKTVASAAREYKPAAVLWSDGLAKTRWVMLPAGAKIDSSDMDAWSFPTGTKFWKEFRIGTERIETRFFWKIGASWVWTTYRWSEDGAEAVRLTDGATNVDGSNWDIPSEAQCDMCHAGHADKILGFEALNLGLDGATGVTLATLRSEGLLTDPPPADSFVVPDDGTGLASEALRWTHVNCGTPCHNPDGLASAYTPLTLRIRTAELHGEDGAAPRAQDLDAYRTAVDQPPRALPQFASQGLLVITPGDVAHSLLPLLASARGVANVPQMPPLGTHLVDDAGVVSVSAWIAAMGTRNPDAGADAQADGGSDDGGDAATDASTE